MHGKEHWVKAATALTFRNDAFIDGEYRPARSGDRNDVISPVDGRTLTSVSMCDGADVDQAVRAARIAFEDGRWSKLAPGKRKAVLNRFAALIEQHSEELGLLETLDMGKPIAVSTAIDLPATAGCFAWYAEAIDKVYGEVAPTHPDVVALVKREPLGVVGAIVPWNFPLLMAAWKLAPALASGNSVVLKPSERSPLSALRLAEIAMEAGLPAGVFNVVPGLGQTAGEALALHMDVDGLFFTGSGNVGRRIMECAARSNLKRVALELGGKSPNLLLASYRDTGHAATVSASSAFFNQGEMCTSPSRLIVEDSVYDRTMETLVKFANEFECGDPLDPETEMGALVDRAHLESVEGKVVSATEEGANIAAGGRRTRENSGGSYFQPTVLCDVNNDMNIAREEVFGPVLSVIRARDEEDAVRIGNDTDYGLAAAVWTDDLSVAHRVSGALRAGVVYVNCYDCDDMTTPFGGYKQSGFGRDKSLHALDKYTELKTTWINIGK